MNESQDFLLDDAWIHFAASKRKDHRERVKLKFRVLLDFFQDRGLTTRVVLEPGEDITPDLKLFRSDLTDEGFEIYRTAYQKWISGLDKGKPIEDVSVMEKALDKLRHN